MCSGTFLDSFENIARVPPRVIGQEEIRAEDLPIVIFCPKKGGVKV